MSTLNGGPGNIVTNGLVLYLDAANYTSYVSGSTSWYDLTSNNLSGSLVNGPTYSSTNAGSIVFDGVDDYVSSVGGLSTFSFIQNTGIFSINIWIKPTLLGTFMYFIGNNNGSTSGKGFFIGKQNNNSLTLQITRGVGGTFVIIYTLSNFFTDTNWINISISSNGFDTTVYKNGSQYGGSSNIGILSTGDSTQELNIGRINQYASETWNGNIALAQIYNRALTASEVQQNYNAQKTRFGLT
jgi:hypothetical protein